MADPSSSSFIPKRGPAPKRKRIDPSRRVYVFTLVSYILMFATLLATGGVYLYKGYIGEQKDKEVAALNAEFADFSEADMYEVVDFDSRLTQATDRVEKSVSLLSIFESLEQATINTVQLLDLNLEREEDEKFILTASIQTDSFDSTIFQRKTYGNYKTIETILVSEVQTASDDFQNSTVVAVEESPAPTMVTFIAELEIPLAAVPYTVEKVVQPMIIMDPVDEALIDLPEEPETLEDNVENI